ncbi:Zinc finger, MYND-type [Dillenia turbinata]|uniref:ubiquitinyl hydrolase 1 n=1 Tax=Dillenia turbinata TaxID=194707 RepID=A0AAN8VSM1_9MAGN
MLEPREADIPALFLVFVVLPLVAYILLGKWNEATQKKERVSLLAQLAAEEAFRAEAMAAATVIPPMSSSNNGHHVCARCFGPATTRCSRCKSARYCSGKCQIIHWRQGHKVECQQVDNISSSSSPRRSSVESNERILQNERTHPEFSGYDTNQPVLERATLSSITYPHDNKAAPTTPMCAGLDSIEVPVPERRTSDKRISRKLNRETSKREDGATNDSSEEASRSSITGSTLSNIPSKESYTRHKLRVVDKASEEECSERQMDSSSSCTIHEDNKFQSQPRHQFKAKSNSGISSAYGCENEANAISDRGHKQRNGFVSYDEIGASCLTEVVLVKGSIKSKTSSQATGTKACKTPKSSMRPSKELSNCEIERNGRVPEESNSRILEPPANAAQRNSGVSSMGIMKMMGLRKSNKHCARGATDASGDPRKKLKMLFSYEEFVKFFQHEVFDLTPRGLLNCGNSCYANAVLQCLTCTKPLTIYLLQRSHSRACCAKNWCLMCELEEHVLMLRESGGPLSPSRILLHMRSINSQIGDGSQEDAHEFLRLLVASMQSICLEGLGGERKVDVRLQETTFIQHTFGGRLRSKVQCMRCHHESERYENIMDLTLEILGWVESLEDALTQFTTPEDLDGENMYRCGRCAAYVRARKQLSIHEAPNILTIVLKRFQEGRYGKINKCITFPEMLDMIPFMTGKYDIPPLYMLYGVVVHLDTLNASFSGHYVSYVKDLRGTWCRIDDTEVQPVSTSQVMSEGAYILFYIRSCPRPSRACNGKTYLQQDSAPARSSTSKLQKSERAGYTKSDGHVVGSELVSDFRKENSMSFANHTSNGQLKRATNKNVPAETYAGRISMEFSDATSSDWSLFTSSDDASFTTESTRDSFSTVDYTDACSIDPISSIFSSLYAPDHYTSHRPVSCRNFSSSRPQTRYVLEAKGHVLDSYLSTQAVERVRKEERRKQGCLWCEV